MAKDMIGRFTVQLINIILRDFAAPPPPPQIRGMLKIFTLPWTPQLMHWSQVLTLGVENVGK